MLSCFGIHFLGHVHEARHMPTPPFLSTLAFFVANTLTESCINLLDLVAHFILLFFDIFS